MENITSKLKSSSYWLLGVFLLLSVWYCGSKYNWLGDTLLASPKEVYENIKEAFKPEAETGDKFYLYAADTIARAFYGWGIAFLFGIVVGLLLGWLQKLNRVLDVSLEFIRAIPPIFAFPLMLVAFNWDDKAYTWTIIFGCLPIMILTVSRGVQLVSKSSLEILTIAKAGFIIRTLSSFMEVLPSVFLGARLTFSISLIITVVSEMVSTPRTGYALGALARDSEINFDAPMFYTCVIAIGLYGYAANILFKLIENRLGSNSEKL
jgi:NitT/TauT family transport system permease protein